MLLRDGKIARKIDISAFHSVNRNAAKQHPSLFITQKPPVFWQGSAIRGSFQSACFYFSCSARCGIFARSNSKQVLCPPSASAAEYQQRHRASGLKWCPPEQTNLMNEEKGMLPEAGNNARNIAPLFLLYFIILNQKKHFKQSVSFIF